jgi:pilus assembly protein CpaB
MRIVMLGLAAGSAIVAGFMAKGFIGAKPATETVEVKESKTVDVLVASTDVLMGERFADGTAVWKAWPLENVSEPMITREEKPDAREAFVQARARIAIYEGETLMEKKLVLPGQSGFMSAILPKGMRAISVKISPHTSAGGFILPDDRVDVLLTKTVEDQRTKVKTIVTETVLTNVRVLAINQTYRQATEGDTATLELDPYQTEIIAMIESQGDISLALRSIAENDGKSMVIEGPQLSEGYGDDNNKSRGRERLFVRYGFESYTSNR